MPEQQPRAIRLVEDPWATLRHVVEVLALVAAGVWAFYVFIYQERIKPANEPASLDDTITIQRIGQDRTRDVLDVAIHLHNSGKTEISIAADGFDVWGDRYAKTATRAVFNSSYVHDVTNDDGLVEHKLLKSYIELRKNAAGGPPGKNTTIEPDGVVSIPYTIVIPRGMYDVIDARVTAIPVKTPVRQPVIVQIIHGADGSMVLRSSTPGVSEFDNSADFGLLPD